MIKHTLIINYPGMNIGGIEKYFSKLMKYSLEQQYRVIWITKEKSIASSQFKDITDDSRVEKVINKAKFWLKIDPINFNENEQITMLSCEPLHYLYGETIKNYIHNRTQFSHFLVLPHFTGAAYYPERFFRLSFIKKIIFAYFRKMVERLNEDNLIFGFSIKHLDNYEENYHLLISDKGNHVLKSIEPPKSFDLSCALSKAKNRNKYFEIISCGRFDFPHKGYMVGLVKAYSSLKVKYNQVKLSFIGDGPSKHVLEELIKTLPEAIKKDITLLGYISPDKTSEYFKKATVAVGLAGGLGDAARCGLPSIRVRHYCYECEAYGFIGQMEQIKWDESGIDVVPLIEHMIVCSDVEYVNQAQKDFDKIYENTDYCPDFLFNQSQYLKHNFSKTFLQRGRIINFLKTLEIVFLHKEPY